MFCPHCGNNCGDARFCPSCGTKLQQAAAPAVQSGEWKVGMPCPHCGATKLDGDCCAFCGAQLQKSDAKVERTANYSSEIPLGKYKGVNSSLTLYENVFILQRRVIFKNYKTEIPYDQIVSAIYIRPLRSDFGYVVFRWQGNKDLPIGDMKAIDLDHTTIVVADYNEFELYHVFYALRAMAPSSACFRVEDTSEVDISTDIIGEKTLDGMFEKYAPFRQPAIDALRKSVNIKAKQAKVIVDHAFDERQKIIYDADPKAAIRDLNYILAKEEEKREQERQEAIQQIIKDREAYVERERMAAAIARRMKE